MTKEELIKKIDAEIAKLSDNASQMCEEYEGYRVACMEISDVLHEIAKEIQPSHSSNLDEAAEDSWAIYEYRESPRGLYSTCYVDGFKAGVEWSDSQKKMPNSSELISAWYGVKSILQEKDFRGDEWRLAYNAFMFGFSKGLNTRTKKK